MREYITELSKYIIPALMAVYTLCSFACLADKLEKKSSIYVLQDVIMFFMQLLMFTDLALTSTGEKKGNSMEYIFFYVFVQIFLLAAAAMVPVIYDQVNRLLLNNMCMLLGTGLCVISRISFNQAVRQYIIVLLSLAVALFIPWILSQIHFLKKLTWVYGIAGIAMLAVVLLYSEVTYGAEISFTIGGVTFQPSEFVKIIFVFFLASALWEDASFIRVAVTAVFAGAHVVILVLSKDLGSALIFFVGYVFVVFAATRNYLYLLAGALGGSGAAWGAYKLFAHVRDRVITWRNPWTYIDNEGYSITQSLFAIGSGSWFGMGLLKGNPTAIPFVEKDFIFSSICEELGVIFGICIILITIVCFLEMMKMAALIKDRFYQLIVYGIGIMYIFQIFLTIGGGIKLIPLTGVTLPFISYGGSSVMTTMIMFFLIQGIYIRLQQGGGRRSGRKTKQHSGGSGAARKEEQ
ncbi:FtsW/RodA/SpoVE family cell cycle protein [Acetatifactor aquisgranensis]|uniref:FtsW/RodA/SpoVE family cell cycle protein n=1 Tax=Acetatifactor aquisgranensis TaxID=2941233 RepID=UPI00203D600D|nr:FtsW/RodA/SpoVE family cell cycle protein [Acetatifactor aquisgranensis]